MSRFYQNEDLVDQWDVIARKLRSRQTYLLTVKDSQRLAWLIDQVKGRKIPTDKQKRSYRRSHTRLITTDLNHPKKLTELSVSIENFEIQFVEPIRKLERMFSE